MRSRFVLPAAIAAAVAVIVAAATYLGAPAGSGMRPDARLPGRPPIPGEVRGLPADRFIRAANSKGGNWVSPPDAVDPGEDSP